MNQLLTRALTMKKNIVIMRAMKLKTNAKTAVNTKTKKLRINKSFIELFSRQKGFKFVGHCAGA